MRHGEGGLQTEGQGRRGLTLLAGSGRPGAPGGVGRAERAEHSLLPPPAPADPGQPTVGRGWRKVTASWASLPRGLSWGGAGRTWELWPLASWVVLGVGPPRRPLMQASHPLLACPRGLVLSPDLLSLQGSNKVPPALFTSPGILTLECISVN